MSSAPDPSATAPRRWWRAARAFPRDHPWAWDLLTAALFWLVLGFFVLLSLLTGPREGNDSLVPGLVVSSLHTAGVALRRRRPVTAFWLVVAGCVVQLVASDNLFPTDAAVLVVAYALTRYSDDVRMRRVGLAVCAVSGFLAVVDVDDPRSAWRTTSTMALGILLATLATVTDGIETEPGDKLPYLAEDMGTGALVTLGIVSVIAATSAGVVQAARVLDQAPQYRALAYAGTDLATLHRARTLEVGLPLLITMGLTLGFSLLLFASPASFVGTGMLVRFAVAVGLSVGLLFAGLTASRGLLRSAAALD